MPKLKVSIPLTELFKNSHYKFDIVKMLKVDPMYNMVNIEEDQPELIFGPSVDGQSGDSDAPPFYLRCSSILSQFKNPPIHSSQLHA